MIYDRTPRVSRIPAPLVSMTTHVPSYRVLGLQPSEFLPCRDGEWMQTCVDASVSLPDTHDGGVKIVDATHVVYDGCVRTLAFAIRPSESVFTHVDGRVTFEFEKAYPNQVWDRVWDDEPPLDPTILEPEKARLLRERFQREHRDFDFSNAQVSGCAPDPFTFLTEGTDSA